MPLKDYVVSAVDVLAPHARKESFNLMSYVKDVNEWFLPSAQMALDEYEGKEKYPAWAYALASIPVAGKVSKPLTKYVSKLPKTSKLISKSPMTKAEKAEAILKNNSATDDYHTWIRSADDVMDFDEARNYTLSDIGEVSSFPDVTKEMLDDASKSGKIKLYSSKPFSVGGFVTPSKMQAADYAGKGKIYEGIFDIDDIAWIGSDEGQIARMK